jgi:branched-chain amino acid transport system permease protein
MRQFVEYATLGIMLGAIYALIAIGYSLVFGVLGKLNLAHGDVFMSAPWIAVVLSAFLPLWLTISVGIAAAGLFGVLLYWIVFRKATDPNEQLGPAIGSQSFGLILAACGSYFAGGYTLQFPPIVRLPDFRIAEIQISAIQVVVLAVAISTMLIFHAIISRTKFGRAMRAISENETASLILGIKVRRIVIAVFALSSAMAGLAGILYSSRYGVVDPYFGFHMGLLGLVVMVMGGVGNIYGAMAGGMLLGLAQMLATGFLWSGAQQVVPWIILVLVLVLFPQGLFGGATVEQKV